MPRDGWTEHSSGMHFSPIVCALAVLHMQLVQLQAEQLSVQCAGFVTGQQQSNELAALICVLLNGLVLPDGHASTVGMRSVQCYI